MQINSALMLFSLIYFVLVVDSIVRKFFDIKQYFFSLNRIPFQKIFFPFQMKD